MPAWAVQILRHPAKCLMFATVTEAFEQLNVLARVEWHSPDFKNHAEHRGVTLYVPIRAAVDAPAVEGIDLSGYQPTVDWTKVADHWARAKQANLLRGAYHFFRPKQDAAAQARLFLAQPSDPPRPQSHEWS